jgi:hypothetical protein
MASWSNVDEIEITRLRAQVVELEASVKRNQEWLAQKSNEKVEAIQRVQDLEVVLEKIEKECRLYGCSDVILMWARQALAKRSP